MGKKEEYHKLALEVIGKYKLILIQDVAAMMGISRETFYHHKLHESDTIKEAIRTQKVNLKVGLRSKMYNSKHPADRIALYKLLSEEEELQKLNSQFHKHSGDEERPVIFKVIPDNT